MAQDSQPPSGDPLPAQRPGATASSRELAMRAGPYALAQAWDQAAPPPEDESALNLRDLWRMVVKHKWTLLTIALVGLLAALLLSFMRTPLYLATATLQVDKRAARVVQFGKDDPTALEGDDRTAMGTQLEILKSRVLAERVIDELRLGRRGPVALPEAEALPAASEPQPAASDTATPEGAASDTAVPGAAPPAALAAPESDAPHPLLARGQRVIDQMKESYGKMNAPATRDLEQLSREGVIGAFQASVRVQQVPNSRMIRIQVENADPALAARVANAMAQSFISLNLERRLQASAYAKTFLETQLGLTKARLEDSERKLQEYARSQDIVTLDEKTNVANQTFTDFSAALNRAEQEAIRTESDYEAVRTAPETSRQVLESKTVAALKEQRARLENEYQTNAKIYKEDFPRMRQLRGQINELDANLASEVQATVVSVKNQRDAARRQEQLIRSRLQQSRQEIQTSQSRSVDFNLIKREVDTNRELYNGLLQQVKEVGVVGGVETNNIQMVDRAETPLFPYKPEISRNAGLGLLAGLLAGLVLIFLLESIDDSIKLAEEVEKTFQVPLLGVIPKVKGGAKGAAVALLAYTDPRGQVAEAYRSVRTALQFSTADGAPRRLVVTSTTKNEGKSTTALALAINFAQLGERVVLIDADMRNPSIHKFVDAANNHGLSSYLSGHPHEGELTQATDVDNLWVITAGPIPPSPVDLLTGPRLGELMDLLEANGARYIIIDGPPILGLADAIVLGNQIPSVLYVAQASQTRKSHIKDALRRMRLAGIVPRGMVLTKTTSENTAYYTYDHYYGYGASHGGTVPARKPQA